MASDAAKASEGAPQPSGGMGPFYAALLVGMATFTLTAAAVHLSRYWAGDSGGSLDAAYFLQRIWQGGEAGPPCRTLLVTEQGAGLLAGRHLEPVLAAFVPLARIAPRMEALLLAQIVLLALVALPVFRGATQLMGDRVAALLLALGWLASPPAWHLSGADFRTLTVAVLPLALCSSAVAARRPGWVALFALAAASCREEVPWLLLAMAPAALWHGRGHRRGWLSGAILLAAPLVWAPGVIAALGGLSTHLPVEALPARALAALAGAGGADPRGGAAAGAWQLLLQHLGPWLYAAPLGLLWAGPVIVNGLGAALADGLALGSPHYVAGAAAALPFAVAAALGGMGRLVGRAGRRPAPLLRAGAAALALAGAAALAPQLPADLPRRLADLPGGMPAQHRLLEEAGVHIPPHAAALTTAPLTAALAARPVIYEADEIEGEGDRQRVVDAVEWAALWGGSPWIDALRARGFTVVAEQPVVVLRRPEGDAPGPPLCLGR